ncbi:hypothetical protein TWF718_001732 [Orbilia javanica]|uniref:Uncharacterized protein n=1 Tax=Orbilia javanica TaxID=47235 RepID=A0AAN8RHJ8_9PEZI
MQEHEAEQCDTCDEPISASPVGCLCSGIYCQNCFNKHLKLMQKKGRQKDHGRSIPSQPSEAETFCGTVVGTIAEIDFPRIFAEDEKAKWFGLQPQHSTMAADSSSIVETSRLRDLMTQSLGFYGDSPSVQFPSIVSFVGTTGAGKSLLVRSLTHLGKTGNRDYSWEDIQSPIAGSHSFRSVTGEVNLYPDPSTFGTTTPILLADCEGIEGGIPIANEHQKKWHDIKQNHGLKTYPFRYQQEKKSFALEDIYPRLLYILSDVVCYVVSDKAWPKIITRLLKWSTTGPQHAINQVALPSLILVVNLKDEGREEWVLEEGGDILTREFLEAMRGDVATNSELKELAYQLGISLDESGSGPNASNPLKELFLGSYSNVRAHFIPRIGLGKLGQPDVMLKQVTRLQNLIKCESARVQKIREKSMTKFNTNQLALITSYAFSHISKTPKESFDFGMRHSPAPPSVEGHIYKFLKIFFERSNNIDRSAFFRVLIDFIASAIVKKAQKSKSEVVIQLHIFPPEMKKLCKNAIRRYFETRVPYSYVNEDHISASGEFEPAATELYNGRYLTAMIELKVRQLTVAAEGSAGAIPQEWTKTH